MEVLIGIIAVSGLFGAIIIAIYMSSKAKHTERMALIETGQSAEIFKNATDSFGSLKTGLFLVGGGLGFVLGLVLESALNMEPVIVAACALIGAGLGLLVCYAIVEKKEKNN